MHQLNRPSAPACLSCYKHGRDTWQAVKPEEKTEIWTSLNEMQQFRCAYCECGLPDISINKHIEHFRQRSTDIAGTFDWQNLFGSCNKKDSCGKHKDQQQYEHQHLIKMDVEDPEHFLRFLPDGQVVPANNLDEERMVRAQETIRVFNLNGPGPLQQIRKTHVMGYLQTAEEIAQFAEEFDEDEWRPLLDEQLEAVAGMPFETAIRHVLQFV